MREHVNCVWKHLFAHTKSEIVDVENSLQNQLEGVI